MKTTNRLGFLDALRGLAALYVLVYHVALMPPYKPEIPRLVYGFVMLGGSGVMLFFVLSAFSLCLTMPRHVAREMPLASFYTSRVFRIAPLFLVGIAFFVWRDWSLYGAQYDLGRIAISASMLFNLLPEHQHSMVSAGWTIGVEMLFYLIFPLIYRWATNIYARLAGLFISSAAYFVMHSLFPAALGDVSILKYLPVFFVGMIAFNIYEAILKGRPTVLTAIGLCFSAGGVLGLTYLVVANPVVLPFFVSEVWQGLFYAGIMLGAAFMSPLTRWAGDKFTEALGAWSFSIYLSHSPIIFALSPVYQWAYEAGAIPRTLAFATCVAMTLAVVLPVSWVLHHTIELPGMKAGRWCLKALTERRSALRQSSAG